MDALRWSKADSIQLWVDTTDFDSIPESHGSDESVTTGLDADIENLGAQQKGLKRMRSPMAEQDSQETPRAPKLQRLNDGTRSLPSSISDDLSFPASEDGLLSHHSGRKSPTKQLAALQDLPHPIIALNTGSARVQDMREDSRRLLERAYDYADGVGIFSFERAELERLVASEDAFPFDARRLLRTHANDHGRLETGSIAEPKDLAKLVRKAIALDESNEHETVWNEQVHSRILELAKDTSKYEKIIEICNIQRASVDASLLNQVPGHLAVSPRIVDYAIALKEDKFTSSAWARWKTSRRSWNQTNNAQYRKKAIAVSVETKSASKSWTDGIPQLSSWSLAGYNQYVRIAADLNPTATKPLRMPSGPLIIAQGHDWYMLVLERNEDLEIPRTAVWNAVNIGSTRNLFDCYKLLSELHLVMEWIGTVFKPWFYEQVLGHPAP